MSCQVEPDGSNGRSTSTPCNLQVRGGVRPACNRLEAFWVVADEEFDPVDVVRHGYDQLSERYRADGAMPSSMAVGSTSSCRGCDRPAGYSIWAAAMGYLPLGDWSTPDTPSRESISATVGSSRARQLVPGGTFLPADMMRCDLGSKRFDAVDSSLLIDAASLLNGSLRHRTGTWLRASSMMNCVSRRWLGGGSSSGGDSGLDRRQTPGCRRGPHADRDTCHRSWRQQVKGSENQFRNEGAKWSCSFLSPNVQPGTPSAGRAHDSNLAHRIMPTGADDDPPTRQGSGASRCGPSHLARLAGHGLTARMDYDIYGADCRRGLISGPGGASCNGRATEPVTALWYRVSPRAPCGDGPGGVCGAASQFSSPFMSLDQPDLALQ